MAQSQITDRFWSKVDKRGQEECWPWHGTIANNGYGHFWVGGKAVGAHRFSYELLTAPIPPGLTLDHLCRNRRCVNPAHLEPCGSGENVLRGAGRTAQHARQTHCVNGHPLGGENLYLYVRRNGRTTRVCRQCKRDHDSRRRLSR